MQDLEKITEEISTLSLKLDRFEMILEAKTEELRGGVQSISGRAKALSLEIEELKGVRASLKEELQKTLEQKIKTLTPFLAEALAETFSTKTETFIKNHLEALKRIQNETDRTTRSIQSMVRDSKRRIIVMGISLVLAVCLACFVISAGFFYFFPQTHHVRYESGVEQGKQMIYGKVLMENFKKLSPEDQELIFSFIDKFVKRPTF